MRSTAGLVHRLRTSAATLFDWCDHIHQSEEQAGHRHSLRTVALEGLTGFIINGRIELDDNMVECTIRAIALNRKNTLFAVAD